MRTILELFGCMFIAIWLIIKWSAMIIYYILNWLCILLGCAVKLVVNIIVWFFIILGAINIFVSLSKRK